MILPIFRKQEKRKIVVSLFVTLLTIVCVCDGASKRTKKRKGRKILVTNKAQLDSAISIAWPNDVIVMEDGKWTNVVINFDVTATSNAPVILRAQTPGQVILNGESSLIFLKPHLTVEGLFSKAGIFILIQSLNSNQIVAG